MQHFTYRTSVGYTTNMWRFFEPAIAGQVHVAEWVMDEHDAGQRGAAQVFCQPAELVFGYANVSIFALDAAEYDQMQPSHVRAVVELAASPPERQQVAVRQVDAVVIAGNVQRRALQITEDTNEVLVTLAIERRALVFDHVPQIDDEIQGFGIVHVRHEFAAQSFRLVGQLSQLAAE